MAASDLRGDRRAIQRAMEAIISESQRSSAQGQLPGLDRAAPARTPTVPQRRLPEQVAELVFDIPARRRLDDLVLRPELVSEIGEFIHEYSNAALLRANSLEPRHTVLLIGPPGNGKTSLAEVLATELSLPFLSIRYDAIVDSFLGETANRLRRLIDYAALNPCVLFFDEFDAVGKERSDAQETGEIKRFVSTLLMQMDRLPVHAVVVCATNHPELLDRAVWRRFELKLEIGRPGAEELARWFARFEAALGGATAGISGVEFAKRMAGESMSEVEAFTLDVRRKLVLSQGKLTAAQAVRQVLHRSATRPEKQTHNRAHEQKLFDSSAEEGARATKAKARKKTVLPKENPLPGAG